MFQPNSSQIQALTQARQALGRQWKVKLNTIWSNGRYPDSLKNCSADLQDIRNVAGPSWLDGFRF